MGCRKWVSSAPWRPSTFQRRILSLQLMVRSLSPCWMPSQVGTMALDSTGMVPSPGAQATYKGHSFCFWQGIGCHNDCEGRCGGGSCLTVLYFGAELALLGVLKQRLMALDFIPSLAAGLIKQSAVPTRCRAVSNRISGDIRCWHNGHQSDMWFGTQ